MWYFISAAVATIIGIVLLFTSDSPGGGIGFFILGFCLSLVPAFKTKSPEQKNEKTQTNFMDSPIEDLQDVFWGYGKLYSKEEIAELLHEHKTLTEEDTIKIFGNLEIPLVEKFKENMRMNLARICYRVAYTHKGIYLKRYDEVYAPTITEDLIQFLYEDQKKNSPPPFLGINYNAAALGFCMGIAQELDLPEDYQKFFNYAMKRKYKYNFAN